MLAPYQVIPGLEVSSYCRIRSSSHIVRPLVEENDVQVLFHITIIFFVIIMDQGF